MSGNSPSDDDDDGRRTGRGRAPLVVLHFNDVYEIEAREQEPQGGAARFVTLLRQHEADHPLVLFSGDVFAPSILSTVTRGKHMIPILNLLNISAAVYGNHDFDFGVPRLESLAGMCNFPWLLSNVWDRTTGTTLGNGHEWLVLEWQGYRIGLMGLIEHEWLETLTTLTVDHIRYEDFVDVARKLGHLLRDEHHVDLVIALTHMRSPNDERLAREVPELDLILGGHDHDYSVSKFGRVTVIKSGSDFRDANRIDITILDGMTIPHELSVSVKRLSATGDIPADQEAAAIVKSFADAQTKQMDKVIGRIGAPLDARFEKVRTQETNVANWVANIMAEDLQADVALLNAGSLRADQIIPVGPFRVRDLIKLLPMHDELVILSITGQQLHCALENSVSKYPAKEGRFPCVSGIRFAFDPNKPEGCRIPLSSVTIRGQPLDLNGKYRFATKLYLYTGRDGYTCLSDAPVLVTPEELPALPVLVRNHLTMMNVAKALLTPDMLVNHAASRFLQKRQKTTGTNGSSNTLSSPDQGSIPTTSATPATTVSGIPHRSLSADASLSLTASLSDDTTLDSHDASSSSLADAPSQLRRSTSSSACPPRPTIVIASPTSTIKRVRPAVQDDHLQDLLEVHADVDGRVALL